MVARTGPDALAHSPEAVLPGPHARRAVTEPAITPPYSTPRSTPDDLGKRPRRWRRRPPVAVAYLLIACALTGGLWFDPGGRVLANAGADQYFFEWAFTYTAHALTHFTNPLFTTYMNAPLGVNLAANTSVVVIGAVFTPITLAFGAPVTFAVVITLSLAGTAYGWYWVFSRHTRLGPMVSAGAAALCGFGPGIMAHANGHLNFAAQFAIPVLLRAAMRLLRPLPAQGPARRRAVIRDCMVLALVAVAQYSISAELLFGAAITAAVCGLTWAAQRPRAARRVLRRVAPRAVVGVVTGAALLAYPVWMQFYGPQHYRGSGFPPRQVSENLLAFGAYSHGSVAGLFGGSVKLSLNIAEENTYFGPVLLVVAVWAAVRAWRYARRRAASRALIITAVVIAVLALGPRLTIGSVSTGIPLPWTLLDRLPVFGAALAGRLALLLTPMVAYLVATALRDAIAARVTTGHGVLNGRWRVGAAAVGIAAILPILPTPLQVAARPEIPRFITSGDWRDYLPAGTTLVSIPPSNTASPDAQRWQTVTDFAFPIDGGYFLGPGPDGRSFVGPVPTRTYAILKQAAGNGAVPSLPPDAPQQAEADLRYWGAGLVVLPDVPPGTDEHWTRYHATLVVLANRLFGPGRHVDDVWIWRPRA